MNNTKHNKFIIRTAKPGDVTGILNVIKKSFLATYPSTQYNITTTDVLNMIAPAFTEESVLKRKESFKNTKDIILVAEQPSDEVNKIVGYCVMVKKNEVNQLQSIYILPEYTSMGLGQLFWRNSIELLDNNKDIIVHVAVYNEKAISFYRKIGFEDTGKRFTEERHLKIPEIEMIRHTTKI